MSNSWDSSPLGSIVHGISQAKMLEWVVISFPRGSSWIRDWTCISCFGKWILYHWATWKALVLHNYFVVNTGTSRIDVAVVQSPSHVLLSVTPWTAACQVSLSLTISWSLLKIMSIALVMPSSHLILWRPLLLLPSIFSSISNILDYIQLNSNTK